MRNHSCLPDGHWHAEVHEDKTLQHARYPTNSYHWVLEQTLATGASATTTCALVGTSRQPNWLRRPFSWQLGYEI